MNRPGRVLVALLAVAVVGGIVALQVVDDAKSRVTVIPTTTSTSTRESSGAAGDAGAGHFAGATDMPCTTLTDLVANAVHALVGDAALGPERSRAIARDLRTLARREGVPSRVRASLRELARFFTRASHGLSLDELGTSLGAIAPDLVVVSGYTAQVCAGTTTPSSTRPLR
jgi:hypothetical protein